MHLDRLVTILEAVAVAGQPVTPSELQKMTGIPRPTCYRLLTMLAENRLLDVPEHGMRYVIGERLLRIALLAKTDTTISSAAPPPFLCHTLTAVQKDF